MYPAAFLEIQLRFARRMADLSGIPYQQSALRNTALYRILGLDWSLDPHDPVWQRFSDALTDERTGIAAAYDYYAERCAQGLVPDYEPSRPHWGCFSFEYDAETRVVRLHFAANLETPGVGPLSSRRQQVRLAELRSMFAHIHQAHPDVLRVNGGSWLYNRVEYLRLFPPEFGASASVVPPALIARGLWGQFLRHGNRMNEEFAVRFLTGLAGLRDAEAFATCFPYQNLLTEAPIQCFYAFYGLA